MSTWLTLAVFCRLGSFPVRQTLYVHLLSHFPTNLFPVYQTKDSLSFPAQNRVEMMMVQETGKRSSESSQLLKTF